MGVALDTVDAVGIRMGAQLTYFSSHLPFTGRVVRSTPDPGEVMVRGCGYRVKSVELVTTDRFYPEELPTVVRSAVVTVFITVTIEAIKEGCSICFLLAMATFLPDAMLLVLAPCPYSVSE